MSHQMTDDEARDIAFSMAEDEESDRQAAEQAAADEAFGVTRPQWEFDLGDAVQNIEEVPF